MTKAEQEDFSRRRQMWEGRERERKGDGDKIPGRRRGEMCRVVDWGGHVVSVVEGAVDEG